MFALNAKPHGINPKVKQIKLSRSLPDLMAVNNAYLRGKVNCEDPSWPETAQAHKYGGYHVVWWGFGTSLVRHWIGLDGYNINLKCICRGHYENLPM